jgi:putative transposase
LTFHSVIKKFEINLNYEETVVNKNKIKKICAMDPGICIFMTLFSEDEVVMFGVGCREKIDKLCEEIDIIKSRINKKLYTNPKNEKKYVVDSKRKRNLRKAMHKKIEKIQNIRNELHTKVINFLVKHYSQILISHFKTSEMIKTLRSKEARIMNNLGFYQFKLKLIAKCKEKNIGLVIKSESYTTIECTGCGFIGKKSSSRVHVCESCGLVIHRDIGSARSQLLRNVAFC